MKAAIVIPCYNRTESLSNLLRSIDDAVIDRNLDLVFSIDFSGSNDVARLADSFFWPHGSKLVIKHPVNIGLRSNILFCGDLLLKEYDRIILLEDDLVVAQDFVNYALRAADFYEDCPDIAGISLFSYYASEEGLFQFYPLKDEYDTFFIQWPSSWGQLWTRRQWERFRQWLSFDYDFENINLPQPVKEWKESWKKYYAAYLVETNKFFVYPYYSLSGESCSPGVHFDKTYNNSYFNNSLQQGANINYNFREFNSESLYRYDCFFQLLTHPITIEGKTITISFDLYGTKKISNIDSEYVVTSKTTSEVKPKFGNKLLPFELNILKSVRGQTFSLLTKEQFAKAEQPVLTKRSLRMIMGGTDMIKYIINRISSKMRSLVGF